MAEQEKARRFSDDKDLLALGSKNQTTRKFKSLMPEFASVATSVSTISPAVPFMQRALLSQGPLAPDTESRTLRETFRRRHFCTADKQIPNDDQVRSNPETLLYQQGSIYFNPTPGTSCRTPAAAPASTPMIDIDHQLFETREKTAMKLRTAQVGNPDYNIEPSSSQTQIKLTSGNEKKRSLVFSQTITASDKMGEGGSIGSTEEEEDDEDNDDSESDAQPQMKTQEIKARLAKLTNFVNNMPDSESNDFEEETSLISPTPQENHQKSASGLSLSSGKRPRTNDTDSDEDFFQNTPEPKSSKRRMLRKGLKLTEESSQRSSKKRHKTSKAKPRGKDENEGQSTFETFSYPPPSVDCKNWAVLPSRLGVSDTKRLQDLAAKYGFSYQRNIDSKATHVVVEVDDENKSERTFKYLQGISFGIMIVGLTWVEDCLSQGRLLSPASYEVKDWTGEEGPRKAREAREKKVPLLLEGYEFALHGKFRTMNSRQLVSLIEALGGVVVRHIRSMSYSTKMTGLILVEAETEGDNPGFSNECLEVFCQVDTPVVSRDWIIECIGTYSIVSIQHFLQHQASDEQLRNLGYSESLIRDMY